MLSVKTYKKGKWKMSGRSMRRLYWKCTRNVCGGKRLSDKGVRRVGFVNILIVDIRKLH